MIRVGIPVALILLISAPQTARARGPYAYMCYDYVHDLLGKRDKYCEMPRWARARSQSAAFAEVKAACLRAVGQYTKAHVAIHRKPFHRLMRRRNSECNSKLTLIQVLRRKYREATVKVPCKDKKVTVTVREYRNSKGKVRFRKWIAANGSSITQPYSVIKRETNGKITLPRNMAKFFCGSAGTRIYGTLKRWFRSFHAKRYKALLKMCRAKKYKPKACYEIKTRTSGSGVRD